MIFVVVAAVGRLQGCWQTTAGDRVVEEQWTAPRAGIMLSMRRTVHGNQLVEYEWVLLREHDRTLEYDFPQHVGYERDGESLLAWVEGTTNGKSRRVEFPYRRVVCPPGN